MGTCTCRNRDRRAPAIYGGVGENKPADGCITDGTALSMRMWELAVSRWRGRMLLLHRGHIGLWVSSLLLGLGTFGVGTALVFDGKGVKDAPAYGPVRQLMSEMDLATVNGQMRAWGIIHLLIGAAALWPLLSARTTTFHRGLAMLPLALLWALSSIMFEAYALGHDGTGSVAATVWLMVAGLALTTVLTKTGLSRFGDT